MKKNMGGTDKTIRVVIAIALLIQILMGRITGGISIIASIAAIIFLLTSSVGICPLYTVLGISTKKKDPDSSDTMEESQISPEPVEATAPEQESADAQDEPTGYNPPPSPDESSEGQEDNNRGL